jgi:hypothetical protein
MLSLLFNRIINILKPNKMENKREKIEFDYTMYQLGLYDAYTIYHKDPFEITSIRNGMAIGWIGDVAYNTSVEHLYLSKRPRKVWVHIIESPDGILNARVTDYKDVSTYKNNTLVKQIEVEI